MPLLIGSYSPDMMSKWFVYGIHIGPWDLKAHDPAQFHRGWPGLGFTHWLLYGVVVGLLLWKGAGSKTWGISFLIGEWAHALTDTGDTVGTMLSPLDPAHRPRRLGLRRPDRPLHRRGRLLQRPGGDVGCGLPRLRPLQLARDEAHVFLRYVIFPADRFWSWLNRLDSARRCCSRLTAPLTSTAPRGGSPGRSGAHVIKHYPYDLELGWASLGAGGAPSATPKSRA